MLSATSRGVALGVSGAGRGMGLHVAVGELDAWNATSETFVFILSQPKRSGVLHPPPGWLGSASSVGPDSWRRAAGSHN